MIGVDLNELQDNEKQGNGQEYAQTEVNVKPLFDKEAEKRHVRVNFSPIIAKTAVKLNV
jgi:hypothetical protein